MSKGESPRHLNPLQAFGHDVRQVRTGRGITQKGLGRATGYSESYVSKVESGAVVPAEKFAEGCDRVFGTNGLFVRQLRHALEGDHPSWFVPYLQLEEKATRVLDYSALTIMGMLQTPEYARAIFRAGHPRERPEVIDGKVSARMRRRTLLDAPKAPALWIVLHEACLRTVVGGAAVMANQLKHLLDAVEAPNIDIQVLPFSTGAAAAHTLPFTLLEFADSPTVLHTDSPIGGRLHHARTTVRSADDMYERLRAHALSPDDSVARIDSLFKEFAP